MTRHVLHLLIALSIALMVEFSVLYLVVGYLVGIPIMRFLPMLPDPKGFRVEGGLRGRQAARLLVNMVIFAWDFVVDLTVSNIQLAWDVLTPRDRYTPRLIDVPVGDLTDFELALLATRITLTPGTLSIDVTEDRQFLVVHAMYPPTGDAGAAYRRPLDLLKRGL